MSNLPGDQRRDRDNDFQLLRKKAKVMGMRLVRGGIGYRMWTRDGGNYTTFKQMASVKKFLISLEKQHAGKTKMAEENR